MGLGTSLPLSTGHYGYLVNQHGGRTQARVPVVVCEVIVSHNGLILSPLFYVTRTICNADCVLVKKAAICVFKSE